MRRAIATLNSLRDINDVTPLTETDQPMVEEIVAVLKKFDALDRFGLTLLHQHFSVSADEVLLETTDIAARTQLIRPVPKSTLEFEDYVETSWRLDTGQPMMHCVCRRDPDTGSHNHYHVKQY
jgi:hypothetical protein